MKLFYHVDAEIKAITGEVFRDYHLETESQAEAESAFLRAWFYGEFWDVRIWKEWKEDK